MTELDDTWVPTCLLCLQAASSLTSGPGPWPSVLEFVTGLGMQKVQSSGSSPLLSRSQHGLPTLSQGPRGQCITSCSSEYMQYM